ncbi:MAG: hypothetical protein HYZ85_00955 [Candidatus Omnitrophica bacterium]|nr:hypothetical protein [Candidatus Omnitrophota bacterium]
MSTFIGQTQSKFIRSEEELSDYFSRHIKSRNKLQVGLEAEFLGVHLSTGKALPYEGPFGIHAVLKYLASHFGYEPVRENGNIIALSRGDNFISLEPGGQVELSAPPVHNVFDMEHQIQAFFKELGECRKEMPDIGWLAYGIQPFSRLEEVSWVPKQRYAILAEYMKPRGMLSHHMMKLTATNQINLDYWSEDHAMMSLKVALGITSMVSAFFANSPFSEGRPNGFLTRRLEIWNHTSPDRSGLIVEFTKEGLRFRDYLEYILEMPLIFIVREEKWIAVGDRTFRQFIQKGFQGYQATLGDYELHLSTAFPEVRLKQYLEIRGMDGQSADMICAAAAFWKGILYDETALELAWKLVSFASETDRLELHRSVPREGLKATLGDRPILAIVRELVEISCASLARQGENEASRDECTFLARIREKLAKPGKSPADILLEKWDKDLSKSPEALLDYLKAVP